LREREQKSQLRAKLLRGRMPNAEVILWSRLRRHSLDGRKFRRQFPIGPYIADFASPLARLVIELDGISHWSEEAQAFDEARSAYMRARGWTILRFSNDEVFKNLNGVLEVIWRSEPPSSAARGRAAATSPVNRGRKE
jgi:very-short-patch-repair endonuclease